MPTLHVLRVFTDDQGEHGNPLGVFLDGGLIAPNDRQAVAQRLGFSETVFVDSAPEGRVSIHTPTVELPFAGHPLVGTAWLLRRWGVPVKRLTPPAGEVTTWNEGPLTWIRADPQWCPVMELREFSRPQDVDALTGPPDDAGFIVAWAWTDERAGEVRSRVFARDVGIEEDQATGSAVLRLAAALDREIAVTQGRGSRLLARPGEDGRLDLGGRVALVETKQDKGR